MTPEFRRAAELLEVKEPSLGVAAVVGAGGDFPSSSSSLTWWAGKRFVLVRPVLVGFSDEGLSA